MIKSIGKQKRIDHIFSINRKALIVPVDDLLISGPSNHLDQYVEKIKALKSSPVSAILGYPGIFNQFYDELEDKAWILNLSTSTVLSDHTNKQMSLTLENAIVMGCDAVAVHVNITSPFEGEMIRNLGITSCECHRFGIPLMAIMYVRKPGITEDDNYDVLKNEDNSEYVKLVGHACRIAVELGADMIKTNFTGSCEGFKSVIYAAGRVPVVTAGGVPISEEKAIENAKMSLVAGAMGVCFGRNVFYRDNVDSFLNKLKGIIANNYEC